MRFWIMVVVVILIGCGGDENLEEIAPVASFLSATPPGQCIPENGTITVTFNNPPRDVTVSHGTVTIVGKTATITGLLVFRVRPIDLTIIWADGTQVLYFMNLGCYGNPYENHPQAPSLSVEYDNLSDN